MLSKQSLIKEISVALNKTKVVELSKILKEQNFPLPYVIDLTFFDDKNVAFRASWLLENVFLQNPEDYLPDLENLVNRVKEVENPGCKRHYAKIIMYITSPHAKKLIRLKLEQIDLEPVVEQLFNWLIDPEVLVAVKAFACEALFNMRFRYPWIIEELPEQLRYLMRNGSAGIQSKGKKLLALIG